MAKILGLLAAICAAPAFAQSTTVTTQQQQPAAPPPSTTTVTTQPAPAQPPPPSTEVVVNPNPPPATTTTASSGTRVVTSDSDVVTTRSGRSAGAIVATDAIYGGLAGAVVGGGITLLNSGNNWQRDIMIGAGAGILVGAAFGIYEATNQPSSNTVVRAAADPEPGRSMTNDRFSTSVFAGRF